MIRNVRTRFPFNGLPKGHVFSYDPETDQPIVKLIQTGLVEDVTEELNGAQITVFAMPSIESQLRMGEIGGEGEDQLHDGGLEGESTHDAGGAGGLQGDQGTRPKVAKRR